MTGNGWKTNYLWWFGGWLIIVIPTLLSFGYSLQDPLKADEFCSQWQWSTVPISDSAVMTVARYMRSIQHSWTPTRRQMTRVTTSGWIEAEEFSRDVRQDKAIIFNSISYVWNYLDLFFVLLVMWQSRDGHVTVMWRSCEYPWSKTHLWPRWWHRGI